MTDEKMERDEAVVRKLDSELWRKPANHGTLAALRPAPVLMIPENGTVMSVCELWSARRIGCILTLGDDGHVTGIITCQDLAYRVVADGLDPHITPLRQIMTFDPVIAAESTSMIHSLELMLTHRIKHLPVMSEDGVIVGVVDFMKVFHETISYAQRKSAASEQLLSAMVSLETELGPDDSNPDLLTWVKSLYQKTVLPDLLSIASHGVEPLVVDPKLSVHEAAQLMKGKGTTIACIRRDAQATSTSSGFQPLRISGILTPVDIVLRVLGSGLDAESCSVATVMTPQPDVASSTTSVYDAVKMMFNGMYLHLPLVEGDGRLLAIVDALTLLEATKEQIYGVNQDITIPIAADGPIWDQFTDLLKNKSSSGSTMTSRRMSDVINFGSRPSGSHYDLVQGPPEVAPGLAIRMVHNHVVTPSAALTLAQHDTRSFGPRKPNEGLSDDNNRNVSSAGGDCSIMASIDDNIVIRATNNGSNTRSEQSKLVDGDEWLADSTFAHGHGSKLTPEKGSSLEMSAVVNQLSNIFKNVEQYKRLLRCHEPDAQKLLDAFQTMLDMPQISSDFRRQLIVATQRLSKRVGLYPICYELTDVELLGDHPVAYGSFADIYKGRFLDQTVCLKVIRLYQTSHVDSFLKQFSAEAVLWGQLLHPNLLPIYGLYRYNTRLCLVSPWMEYGDVNAFLKNHPNVNRTLLVTDIVSGLTYLHDHDIVHGDIKGVNVLVNASHHACLADFGLSAITDTEILHWTSHSSAASKGGSTRWQAPELFNIEDDHVVHNSKASDIYALGCVMYEIFTGNLPFFELARDSVIMLRVNGGARPSRPPDANISWLSWGLTESLWSLMVSCWNEDSNVRPTARSIGESLASNYLTDDRPIVNGNILSPPRFRNSQSNQSNADTIGDINTLLASLA